MVLDVIKILWAGVEPHDLRLNQTDALPTELPEITAILS